MIYITNHRSHATRVQSESRVHRRGLKHPVLYIDILSTRKDGKKTVDHTAKRAIELEKDFADFVLDGGDLDAKV